MKEAMDDRFVIASVPKINRKGLKYKHYTL
jgi:hypothetical protein